MHTSYWQYFVNRARGGAGMIVTDPLGIAPHQSNERIVAWNDRMEGDLKRLADGVESEGCLLLGQIQDSGRGRHVPGRTYNAVGASPLPDDLSYTVPHPMSHDEIMRFIDLAAASSARMQRCGFSGIEISAGHGHLFHQFLSPRSNQREDAWGGDASGRAKLLVEVCRAIRAACGGGFILGVKLPGDDGIAGSITPERAGEIAAHVVARVKVDYLTYAQGTHHRTLEMHLPDDSTPRLTYMPLIRQLRTATPGVPVMALGRITDPAEAEAILQRGDAELVGLGRALITDAAWPIKAARGRARDIRYCVSCNTCWKAINSNRTLACDNNPRLSNPDELEALPLSEQSRKVVVVGAGVAGLEAAMVAAQRGNDVIVFGSSDEVGGKTRLQASMPLGESLSSIYDYQFVEAQKAGVRFFLGHLATAQDIIAQKPDHVILATGAVMTWPADLPASLRGTDTISDLRTAMQGLQGITQRQRGAAVIFDLDQTDGTYVAAERLRDIFDRVVILSPRETIAEEVVLVARQRILRRFHERGIEVITLVQPQWGPSVEDEARLEYVSVFGGPVHSIGNLAFFAYASPRAPEIALLHPLRIAGIDVRLVGDCKIARDTLAATSEGHAAATQISLLASDTSQPTVPKEENMTTPALAINPATTALVLIDLQHGIVAMNVHPRPSSEVVARAAQMADAFRKAGAPVVLVTVGNLPDGKDALSPKVDGVAPPATTRPDNWSTVVPELGPHATDVQITKRQWGAFYGTELDLQLRRRGIKTIVLAGISTHVGVESTARDAFERGYDQVLVEDAMASPSAEAHAGTVKFVFPRIGLIRTTDEVLQSLSK